MTIYYTKYLSGISMADETTVLVTTDDTSPDLTALVYTLKRGETSWVPHSYDSLAGGWPVELGDTDYVLKFDVDSTKWFAGEMTVTHPTTTTFVWHGPSACGHETIAWSDKSAVAGEDPKDPWPPPGTPVTLGSTSQTWFHTELHNARAATVTPLGFDEPVQKAS